MDGIELFDCKMFSMSPNEVRQLLELELVKCVRRSPWIRSLHGFSSMRFDLRHQRLILEVGYEALYNMGSGPSWTSSSSFYPLRGMRKNTLVNTTCGVYVGCGNVEQLDWAPQAICDLPGQVVTNASRAGAFA